MSRTLPLALILSSALAVVVLLAAALEDQKKGGVRLTWDAGAQDAPISDSAGGGRPPFETVIYVTNNSGEVLHSAVIHLSEAGAEAELGLSIGTVTPVSTIFDGDRRSWALGDLEPGKRYGLRLGLWFSTPYLAAAPETLALSVELSSPDLAAPIRSNELSVALRK